MAQRGRIMPDEYMDYSDLYSTSDDKYTGYISLFILIAMGIGIVWFKSALNSSRKEEIRNKTQFLTYRELCAFDTAYKATKNSNRIYPIKENYAMEKG